MNEISPSLDRLASLINPVVVSAVAQKRRVIRDLVGEALNGKSLLVRGASGWFGQACLDLVDMKSLPRVVTQTSSGQVRYEWGECKGQEALGNLGEEFDFCLDAAFVTRDNPRGLSQRKLQSSNSKLNMTALELMRKDIVGRYIGFSSGAAIAENGTGDSYGSMKKELEVGFGTFARSGDQLLRVWSVSGAKCHKKDAFAFSDFISQAIRGNLVRVNADHLVFRRYCAIEELLAIGFTGVASPSIWDSGGTLIEIGDLARIVVETLNPLAHVERPPLNGEQRDYFSDSEEFNRCLSSAGMIALTIQEQIINSVEILEDAQ
jgi:hypothetical protein